MTAAAAPAASQRDDGRLRATGVSSGTAANRSTGSAMPFSRREPRFSKRTGMLAWATPRTVLVTSTSPAAAVAQTRAAMLTAEPMKPSAVSTASPAWMPMPTLIGRSGCVALASSAA